MKPDIPPDVVELHREKFERIRSTLGTNTQEILAKEETVGPDTIYGAFRCLISWKSWNKIDLTFTEGMVGTYEEIHMEVNNGGFHQYFFNSAGNHWPHLLQVLIEGGDTRGEQCFRKVLSIFPNSEPSTDRYERQKQLLKIEDEDEEGMWEHFETCEDEYFRKPYPSKETCWAAIRPRLHEIEPLWM